MSLKITLVILCRKGDLTAEGTLLDWILDEDTRKLDGEIEEVNRVMLDRLIDENPLVSVFFCKFLYIFISVIVKLEL